MNASIPQNIPQYLAQVRDALAGADPAVVQDALYDAEEHLRAELAANPGVPESELLRRIATSYGSPEEVAAIYRDAEVTVSRAMRAPAPPARRTLAGRFFGVAADPRTWGALFYMLFSLVTGVFYFAWTAIGVSLSLGLSLLVVGVFFIVFFVGTTRLLSLVEGRIVEALLGVRMPRRPAYPHRHLPLLKRIGQMFTDARTWSTLLYFVLMLPLGLVYFARWWRCSSTACRRACTSTARSSSRPASPSRSRCCWAWWGCSRPCTSRAGSAPCMAGSRTACWCPVAPTSRRSRRRRRRPRRRPARPPSPEAAAAFARDTHDGVTVPAVGMPTAAQFLSTPRGRDRSRNRGTTMLIVAFPKAVFWPLTDWSVALLDTLRVAAGLALPAPAWTRED